MEGDNKSNTKTYNTRSRTKQPAAKVANPPQRIVENRNHKEPTTSSLRKNVVRNTCTTIKNYQSQSGVALDHNTILVSNGVANRSNSTWNCATCSFENNGLRKKKCEVCLTERQRSDDDEVSVIPLKSSTSNESTLKRNVGASIWKCYSCMFLNKSDATMCFACKSTKQADTSNGTFIIGATAAAVTPPKFETKPDCCDEPVAKKWSNTGLISCPDQADSCSSTISTYSDKKMCDISGQQRFVAKQNSKWTCSACTFENDTQQKKCDICNTEQSGESANNEAISVSDVRKKDDSDENLSLALANLLPTLPFDIAESTGISTENFEEFRQLLNTTDATDEGILFRRMCIQVGAMHAVLNCLRKSTHQSQMYQLSGIPADSQEESAKSSAASVGASSHKIPEYWAKGTGYGTGSTQQLWNAKQAFLLQKTEEDRVTVLLAVLSSYINPNDHSSELLPIFYDILQQSCLIPALRSYLRNDSVLDIKRHIPLYRAILQLVRAIALSDQLVTLLMPNQSDGGTLSIAALLVNMKICVDIYANRLKLVPESEKIKQEVAVTLDGGDDEELALLIPVIQDTTALVQKCTKIEAVCVNTIAERPLRSIENCYLELMKNLQFGTAEMIVESENGYKFVVSHHFEAIVRAAGDRSNATRVKRLAQESVTLTTSLPLSFGSTVFVRCDNDRMDVMKVLITGPAETPYANGCFEFDVYFPLDYPNSPMMINLETTGRRTVRFNPNLYHDGKVCLSVLGTWRGRPEENWNAQTSSFLQVLVSIQSLILVPEPYFNEPGFEHEHGKAAGNRRSREYNSSIYQASVRWAMLEQIKNPCLCFKDIIHTHYWLKREEICNQIEEWITELSKCNGSLISLNLAELRRLYRLLRVELANLPVPQGLEDLNHPFAGTTENT